MWSYSYIHHNQTGDGDRTSTIWDIYGYLIFENIWVNQLLKGNKNPVRHCQKDIASQHKRSGTTIKNNEYSIRRCAYTPSMSGMIFQVCGVEDGP